ncbi:MAG: Uma2 family endonuclease [Planctomycetaceae bacterium]
MATTFETQTDAMPVGEESLYEMINGEWTELPHMGTLENTLANFLSGELGRWNEPEPKGWFTHEDLFELHDKLKRRPDLAFVPFDRWPEPSVPDVDAWPIVPALAVEIVSKNNLAEDLLKKLRDYFTHGVALVWVIYPRDQVVYVYHSFQRVEVLSSDDVLTGGEVLPGFELPLRDLFASLRKPGPH